LLAECQLTQESVEDRTFFHGRGCEQCNHTGYLGRMGIFEWLRVTDAIRNLIGENVPRHHLRLKAVEQQGMRTLRDEGLRAAFDGHTTIEEIIKYT
jgi:type IV pilus assembly protein PilB